MPKQLLRGRELRYTLTPSLQRTSATRRIHGLPLARGTQPAGAERVRSRVTAPPHPRPTAPWPHGVDKVEAAAQTSTPTD